MCFQGFLETGTEPIEAIPYQGDGWAHYQFSGLTDGGFPVCITLVRKLHNAHVKTGTTLAAAFARIPVDF